ncbi:MAG: M14 family metallopeptidase [Bacteroidota bacterium]
MNTETVPIQFQNKGTFDLGNGVFCSNNFDGARLNGVVLTKDTLITVLVTPENTPINSSPWYAFKLWSEVEQEITLKLSYTEGYFHRYRPKLSNDGLYWEQIDSTQYTIDYNNQQKPVSASLNLQIGPDTLWISAQELITSSHVDKWISGLESNSFVTKTKIGESHAGRPINALKIGESDDNKFILILSRQHPPEITGFLAMQAFVETICTKNEIADSFRGIYNAYVIPLANPDGVNNGHWRHNNGGIDLNRDWSDFNQPETRAIRDYVEQLVDSTSGKVVFFIDFHSTWEDIYYINHGAEAGNIPGLVQEMIRLTGDEFPGYSPNIKSLSDENNNTRITSDSYFFSTYGAQSLTYEVGDNTPRAFIRKKAEVSAMKMMELLIGNY